MERWLDKGKKLFISEIEQNPSIIYYLSEEEFDLISEAKEKDTTFACFSYRITESNEITDIAIFINTSIFIQDDGKDFSHCIPIMIRHETAELWHQLNTGVKAPDGIPHKRAIFDEFLFAYRLGLQDAYLELIYRLGNLLQEPQKSMFLEENEYAYNRIKQLLKIISRQTPSS